VTREGIQFGVFRREPAEMEIHTGLLVVAILSALWGVVDAILIAVALDRRGIHVNMLLFRVFFFRYLSQYREVTLKETGTVGPLFYSFITAMNVALVSGIVGWVLKAG
jgi:hypothetical protein